MTRARCPAEQSQPSCVIVSRLSLISPLQSGARAGMCQVSNTHKYQLLSAPGFVLNISGLCCREGTHNCSGPLQKPAPLRRKRRSSGHCQDLSRQQRQLQPCKVSPARCSSVAVFRFVIRWEQEQGDTGTTTIYQLQIGCPLHQPSTRQQTCPCCVTNPPHHIPSNCPGPVQSGEVTMSR